MKREEVEPFVGKHVLMTATLQPGQEHPEEMGGRLISVEDGEALVDYGYAMPLAAIATIVEICPACLEGLQITPLAASAAAHLPGCPHHQGQEIALHIAQGAAAAWQRTAGYWSDRTGRDMEKLAVLQEAALVLASHAHKIPLGTHQVGVREDEFNTLCRILQEQLGDDFEDKVTGWPRDLENG